jgi:gp16 family phage-associated protein
MNDQAARQAIKDWFDANGLSITEWAAARGYKRDQVYAVLNGRTSGRRGQAHAIAVALGLKAESMLTMQQALAVAASEQPASRSANKSSGK